MARVIGPFLAILIAAPVGAIAVHADPTLERCGGNNEMTFVGWSEWNQVTPNPVVSEGHSNNWVGIFVDDLARETYLSAGKTYPECAKIVKPIYDDAEGKSVRKLTIMVKMPTGYDPDNGNWWYGSYDATGAYPRKQGRLGECILCHQQAKETDFLFSKEVLSAVYD
jgi:hypothetical protein